MNNICYLKYKSLKDLFHFKYKGFEIDQLIAIPIWYWANPEVSNKREILGFVKKWDYDFISHYHNSHILFSSVNRRDHSETFSQIGAKVNDKYLVDNRNQGVKTVFHFSIKSIIKSIYYVFHYIAGYSALNKIYMAGHLCMCLNTIDSLLCIKTNHVKVFVALSAVHEEMNFLCQYYALKGARVIGLSHGASFVFKKNIPIDCVNYENLKFECVVWSDMTKREYANFGINPKKLYVAGYPKKVVLETISNENRLKNCLVLLCRKVYDESNLHLLEILKTLTDNYNFYLKLHPSCDFDQYKIISKNYGFHIIPLDTLLTDCMDKTKYDFAVAVNTTSYYEVMVSGIPSLRYDDGGIYDIISGYERDCFSSRDSFIECMSWLKESLADGEYDKIRVNLLMENIGVGLDRYKEILCAF